MMNRTPQHTLCTVDRRPSTVNHRRGFTFVEVLFAIIILGIGMIMLAAMLPVAISQTAQTRDQIAGKAAVENGYAYIKAIVQSNPNAFPPTNDNNVVTGLNLSSNASVKDLRDLLIGNSPYKYSETGDVDVPNRAGRVVPITYNVAEQIGNVAVKPLLQSIQGNRVDSIDSQVQWMAFYRRDPGSTTVQVTIVAMRLQNRDLTKSYGSDPTNSTNTFPKEAINDSNGPFLVPVEIEDRYDQPDVIKFVDNDPNAIDRKIAGTGAYVIIAHSPPPTKDDELERPFRNNGRVFRLAAREEDLDAAAGGARIWDLDPSYDLANAQLGADGVANSADDVPDGSMNTTNHFETASGTPDRRTLNHVYDGQPGTRAWAWIIGKGLLNPSAAAGADNPYQGPTQDISVLKVTIELD